jgi:hypothetical protein
MKKLSKKKIIEIVRCGERERKPYNKTAAMETRGFVERLNRPSMRRRRHGETACL